MASPSEKFSLKWNEFYSNIQTSYQELRENPDFSDVTLMCEEDQEIKAHRIILTACSPFFSSVLKRNKHSHPMIYMRGLKAKDLVSIVDFIYNGEVNIYQEDLDRFLALAQELQLKGLSGSQNENQEKSRKSPPTKTESKEVLRKQEIVSLQALPASYEESFEDFNSTNQENFSLVPGNYVSDLDTNTEDVKAKIDSMMKRVTDENYKFKCNVCQKTSTDKTVMSRHVETHIKGLAYPCKECTKVFRTSNSLYQHANKLHKNYMVFRYFSYHSCSVVYYCIIL